jgi:hypothetical protein
MFILRKEKTVTVKLLSVWLGHPVGSIIMLKENFAKTLVERGAAKIIKTDGNIELKQNEIIDEPKADIVDNEITELKSETESKNKDDVAKEISKEQDDKKVSKLLRRPLKFSK